ncbi:unnamed protein product [Clonostachys solani]|uniref:Dihydrofolate reductase n=1 Tax=Clonostachys solani TaxID=160281 RepID=A0A9N9Z571_9HYPO|nr:unnamed protein product [Clonostachys solani]
MQAPEFTLIVAATRSMGIGLNGTMPWQGLRKEMQYFARVTTRLPPQAVPGSVNAVIMGRKTWDSIPPKFRPLKDRLNIVVTRSAPPVASPELPLEDAVRISSLDGALAYARARCAGGRVFVMGGAQIYEAALRRPGARRVLLTCIDREYGCDTFFPLDLTGNTDVGWTRRQREELEGWTGEQVEEGWHEEAGTRYQFQMWEKNLR